MSNFSITPLDARRLVNAQDSASELFRMGETDDSLPNLTKLNEIAETLVVEELGVIWAAVRSVEPHGATNTVIRGSRNGREIQTSISPITTTIERKDGDLAVTLENRGDQTIVHFASPKLTASLDVTETRWIPRNE